MEELKITGTAEAINNISNGYTTSLTSGTHQLVTDEPISAGGKNQGPSPIDFLCMSLAGCKLITLRMYCQRKQWDAGEINIKVNLVKSVGSDGPVYSFKCDISVTGNLTGEQKERLLQIDKACPVSKILSKGSEVASVIN